MDNVKTGSFIKELRKEKEMTQKQLADRLHITDRAVSKWERGVCAPDIALLEPLAEILGVSIVELIQGERAERPGEPEAGAREILSYSRSEVTRKVRGVQKKYLAIAALCFAVIALICGVLLWKSGRLFVLDEVVSSNGASRAVVYSKEMLGSIFPIKDGISIVVDLEDGGTWWDNTYEDCVYKGLWWSPDGRTYVLALDYGDTTWLTTSNPYTLAGSNLSALLSMGLEETELSKYSCGNSPDSPKMEYQFLQWGTDSASMLIYYSFEDSTRERHTGYFWYNCETGAVDGIVEMDSR